VEDATTLSWSSAAVSEWVMVDVVSGSLYRWTHSLSRLAWS